MSILTKVSHKIFGSLASYGQLGKFGSFKNGSPEYATDIATSESQNIKDIQSLSNFEAGLYDSIVGNGAPLKQDINAVLRHTSRQVGYLYQAGIPEWDAETVYYSGSIVRYGAALYIAGSQNSNDAPPGVNWSFFLRQDKNSITDNSGSWTNSSSNTPTQVTNLSASFTSNGGLVEIQLEADPSNSDTSYIAATAATGGTVSAMIDLFIDSVRVATYPITHLGTSSSSLLNIQMPPSVIKFSKIKPGSHTYSIKAYPIQTGSSISFENVVMHIKEI